jgi:hypothetical protein
VEEAYRALVDERAQELIAAGRAREFAFAA